VRKEIGEVVGGENRNEKEPISLGIEVELREGVLATGKTGSESIVSRPFKKEAP